MFLTVLIFHTIRKKTVLYTIVLDIKACELRLYRTIKYMVSAKFLQENMYFRLYRITSAIRPLPYKNRNFRPFFGFENASLLFHYKATGDPLTERTSKYEM